MGDKSRVVAGRPLQGSMAAHRTIGVLEALAEAADPDDRSLAALALRTGMPRSTVWALLRALEDRGYAERDEDARAYRLTARLWQIARRSAPFADLRGAFLAQAGPAVVERTGESVQLGVLVGHEVLYVGKVDGTLPVRLASDEGRRLPASTTALGKAILSTRADDEVRGLYAGIELPRLTDRSVAGVEALLERLQEARRSGYALDDEETSAGLYCIALPVRIGPGPSAAAISVSLLKARVDPERERVIHRALMHAVTLLADALA